MGKLRKSDIDALTYPYGAESKKAYYVPDGYIPNLYVRVYPSGQKTFFLRYRDERRRSRTLAIGKYGQLTLDEARAEARRRMAEVMDGGDPSRRRAAPSTPTFAEFLPRFDELHLAGLNSADDTRNRLKRQVVPRWGDVPLDALSMTDLLEVKVEMKGTRYEFNRLLENVSSILHRAQEWGVLPPAFTSPTSYVKPYPEKRRDRVLSREERQRLVAAIDNLKTPTTRIYLRLLVLLPFRKSELMRARWDGYDEARRVLTIPALSEHKPTKPQPVPARAAELLRELPRRAGCPWIFPSSRGDGHIKSVSTAWNRVRAEAGLEDVRMHDLRRTLATRFAESGASAHAIRDLLGHEQLGTALHYVHQAVEANRQLLDALADEG